jgi:anti-anti-sigma factor
MKMVVEELPSGVTHIRLDGALDAKGAGEIEVQFAAVTGNRLKLVIDLGGVDFLASIGIRTLLSAVKTVNRRGGKLVVADPTEAVAKVLRTCGADGVIPLIDGLDAAVAAVA